MGDADGRGKEPSSGDDRAPYARAMDWVNQIVTASLMMALPALLGFYIDRWLATPPWFLISGAVLGMVFGFWQFYKLAQRSNEVDRDSSA